ncbi:MAG: hypothetical protein H6624_13335 [Bdellovibrionaceae bacterium]|nr:hypothetical protein [Bdellovibrionales bacterium]MCB9085325.1 hypothetical protein [Pseudobdellovibrionaceae bacterium]
MGVVFTLLFLSISGAFSVADDSEVLSLVCQREMRLNRLAVACYEIGRGKGYDCSQQSLRLTPLKRLMRARDLKSLPADCSAAVAREIDRRNYVIPIEESPRYSPRSLSDDFINPIPSSWQAY